MEKVKLTRREREKLNQRHEMLAASLQLFSEKGYHNVSMHEIAEKSEFAIGTLYKFFPNKEALYKALVLEKCERFEDAIRSALEEPGDEIGKLRNYVRVKCDVLRRNLSFVRLFLAESKGLSFNIKAGLEEELQKRYFAFMEEIASIIERGIQNERFVRVADSFHLAVSIDNVVDTHLLLWLRWPEQYPYPEDPDTILNIFFKGMLAQ